MADGDALVIDSTQPGGSGTIAGETKFAFKGAGTSGNPVATMATWSTANVRYFLLDPVGGNDANVGFVDAAPGAVIAPAGLAKATVAGVQAIIPRIGNGRIAVVLHGPGTLAESIDLTSFVGYLGFIWRGSTDLTNSANDKIRAGGVQHAVGPNGDGSFTAGGGSTTSLVNLAAGAIGAEPAELQYRIRFDAATTTAALRNITRNILAHTTTSVSVGSVLPAVPAGTDTFFIEQPGAVVTGIVANFSAITPHTGFGGKPGVITGLRFNSTVSNAVTVMGNAALSFFEMSGITNNAVGTFGDAHNFSLSSNTYSDESFATVTVGMGLRTVNTFNVFGVQLCSSSRMGCMNTTAQPAMTIASGAHGDQSYFAKGLTLTVFGGTGVAAATPLGRPCSFGRITTVTPSTNGCRVNGAVTAGLNVTGGGVDIGNADFQNCGALPCIKVTTSTIGSIVAVDGCTGSTGNTNFGIELGFAVNGVFQLGGAVANTVTGTLGDINLVGGAVTTHVATAVTNIIDKSGNRISGGFVAPNGIYVGSCVLLTNGDAGAHVIGQLVRASGVTTVIKAQADTAANDTGALMVAVTPPAAGALGYYIAANSPQKWVLFDGAPTNLALAYVSPGTAGQATTTIPPVAATNQKRRLGFVLITLAGNLGLVTGSPENIGVIADGLL